MRYRYAGARYRDGGGARLRIGLVPRKHSHIPTSRKSPWRGGPELPKWYYDTYDPFLAMAAAAVGTKTIRLGTGVCLVVQRDPIHTAWEVSTVDRLSNGRLLFGIGGGWNGGGDG